MRTTIRRTIYWKLGQPVSLAFVSDIPGHPEADDAPPPAPPPPKLKFERPPRWSEKLIRRALGRDREQAAKLRERIAFNATMWRIMREGACSLPPTGVLAVR